MDYTTAVIYNCIICLVTEIPICDDCDDQGHTSKTCTKRRLYVSVKYTCIYTPSVYGIKLNPYIVAKGKCFF